VEVFESTSTWEIHISLACYILIIWYDTDRIENTTSNTSCTSVCVCVCVFVVAGKCLPRRCLATFVSSGSTIAAFRLQRGNTDTQRSKWSHKPLHIFFKIMKVG
jgi:hypothetical protein